MFALALQAMISIKDVFMFTMLLKTMPVAALRLQSGHDDLVSPEVDHYVSFGSSFGGLTTQACFIVDGECYMKYQKSDDSIRISEWYGRVGNNLHQVSNAIFAAKVSGIKRVTTPAGGPVRQIFDFPDNFEIEPDEEFRTRITCRPPQSGHYFGDDGLLCTGVKRSDHTKVLQAHLLPYLNNEARAACTEESNTKKLLKSNGKRELLLHLRSGDLLDSNHFQAKFAPCSFFDVLINDEIGFDHIRVITEPDRAHSCLHYLAEKYSNVTIQSQSVPADACALMHADYLGMGAHSSFSETLSMFNPHPVAVYHALGSCQLSEEHICQGGAKIQYSIPGIEIIRRGGDKVNWMLTYPKESIKKNCAHCFE